MIYKKIDNIDSSILIREYVNLQKNIKWLENSNQGKQCGLQYRDNEDPFISATGKLKKGVNESEYNLINPLFSNTLFEDIIKKYNLVRSRLMWVGPKTCYSLHKDTTMRLHIPLITHPQCLFVFPDDSEFVHLSSSSVYIVDTTRTHSFCNFSNINRLHLIGCVEHYS